MVEGDCNSFHLLALHGLATVATDEIPLLIATRQRGTNGVARANRGPHLRDLCLLTFNTPEKAFLLNHKRATHTTFSSYPHKIPRKPGHKITASFSVQTYIIGHPFVLAFCSFLPTGTFAKDEHNDPPTFAK